MRLDRFLKQEGKTAPQKILKKLTGNNPYKDPRLQPKSPSFSLGWKDRQSCLSV
jgi:hypothetical protein